MDVERPGSYEVTSVPAGWCVISAAQQQVDGSVSRHTGQSQGEPNLESHNTNTSSPKPAGTEMNSSMS